MLNITKIDDGLLFSKDGVNEQIFPLNELVLLVEDISDIVVFKTDDYYETVFQARWQDITIEGEQVTKENIVEKFNAIANTPQGGGTKINAGTNITLQPEADGSITISATGELGGTVSWNDVTDKPSTFTPSAHNHVVADITDLQGKLDEKANVSDIPSLDGYATEEWVNSQGYLTEHQDISQLATKAELATKQDILVSGESIKTVNGESMLGEGNIVIEGGTGDVTKQYVDEQLALKVDKTAYEADKATFALKTEIPSIDGLATSEELQNGLDTKQDKGDYATKEELASKADASALATKQDTLVSGTNIKTINGQTVLGEGNIEIQGGGSGISDAPSDGKKYVRQNANWVQETTVDTSNFATKAELEGKVDDAEIADMLTKTEAASTYQPKGDYLTEIPSEYVTETELSEKGYATTVQLDAKLDTEIYNSDKATFATKAELADKADASALATKQDTLVSGTNIKTVNGNSLLGSGDIIIEGGTGDVTRQYVDEQLALKADKTSVPTVQSSTLGNENNYVYSVGAINDKKNVLSLISSDENETNLNITYQTWNNDTKVMMKLRNASQTLDGAMSSEDKIKLDSINVDTLATKEELNLKANTSDLSNYLTTTNAESTYAKKSEIPSLEGYLQTSTADGKYATKTEIADMLTKTEASTTYKTIASEWYGTQSEYDGITEKDPNVTYFITEG